jgi:predicted PurR-regulated permease PerM
VFATIGYVLAGAPEPVFLGISTALASLIPAVGTLLVWVPVGIFMIVAGHPARGVIELVWCAATVVGVSDYILRPRLVGDEGVPTLVTFVALFGGVEVFGLKGLVVGPVVMSLALATLRMYAREAAALQGRVRGG